MTFQASDEQPKNAFDDQGEGWAPDALDDRLLPALSGIPLPLLVFDHSPDAVIRLVSPAFERTFGYSRAETPTLKSLTRRALPDRTYRADVLTRWMAKLNALRDPAEASAPVACTITDHWGQTRQALVGLVRHADLVIATVQDISEIKTALSAPIDAEACNVFAMTENMPAGAYILRLSADQSDLSYVFFSDRFCEILGVTRAEFSGENAKIASRLHLQDRPLWDRLNEESRRQKTAFRAEVRVIVRGAVKWLRAHSEPRALPDGSWLWEGNLVDITALKEAEQRLQTVIEASRAMVWELDLTTNKLTFGEGWRAVHGFGPQDGPSSLEDWIADLHPEDIAKILGAMFRLRSGKSLSERVDHRRRHRDGHWLWLQVHGGVTAWDELGVPTALSGVTFDITQEMTQRIALQDAQAELREDLQRAQQRETIAHVTGGIAHDVNNLISVVAGTVDVLRRKVADQPDIEQDLERISRSMASAHDLMSNIGGLVNPVLPREAHNLSLILRNAVDLVGSRRRAKNEIRIHGMQDCPIWANPTEVSQVAVNLILNACASGGAGSDAAVTLNVLPTGQTLPERQPDVGDPMRDGLAMAVFTVSDTGTGIPNTKRSKIFKPNFGAKDHGTVGLGLPIVANILRNNHAALWIDSVPGSGTTITIAWPAEPVRPGKETRPKIAELATAPQTAIDAAALMAVNVLVVDDLRDVAEVLVGMLETAGAIAFAESDPIEAQQVLAEAPQTWSVLVTDLHMPGVDGRQMARFARSLTPPVPVVLVTARPETLGSGMTDDFVAVLPKPVSAAQLVQAVRKAVDSRGAAPAP